MTAPIKIKYQWTPKEFYRLKQMLATIGNHPNRFIFLSNVNGKRIKVNLKNPSISEESTNQWRIHQSVKNPSESEIFEDIPIEFNEHNMSKQNLLTEWLKNTEALNGICQNKENKEE